MTSNQRIDEFLKLQDKGISLDEIASTLGIKPQTLKRDLNKNGYKSVKGKYIKKDEKSQNVSIQVSFVDNELNQKNNEKKAKKTTPKKTKVAEQSNKNEKVKVKNIKTSKTKKDKKINFIFSFLTSFLVSLPSVVSTLGNGKNAINKPSIAIATAATINIVLNGNALAATNPIPNGNANCAIAIENLVNIFATEPFSGNISMQDGVTQVSKNELATPPIIANA